MSNFEFNAPQFVNFRDADDLKADRFFDVNEEQDQEPKNLTLDFSSKKMETYEQSDNENQVPHSTVKSSKKALSSKNNFTVMRKVLHEIVNHQIQTDKTNLNTQLKDHGNDIIQQFENLQLSEVKTKKPRGPVKATELFSGVKHPRSEKKSHPMMTRLDATNIRVSSTQSLNSRSSEDSPKDYECSTTSNSLKTGSVKRNASPLHSSKKFISLAEQVEHFYKDTPERYRSKPKKQTVSMQTAWRAKTDYIPKTPNLTTKTRQRKVNYPDEKQREEMELEEIKKHQIKARPLNEKILCSPCLNLKTTIMKKPVTVPQPFSLTEIKKKEPPPKPVFYFKAQPVPTSILSRPVGIPPKKILLPTVPTTPQLKVPSRLRVEVRSEEKNRISESDCLQRNTKIEPFSFDSRMRDLLQKKEELVKKVIEEEKKSFSSFKARPMPDFVNQNEQLLKTEKLHQKTIPQPFNLTQLKGNKSLSEVQKDIRVTPFKARTAAVVHQKPFVPKLQKHEIQPPSDFQLNTEKRAAERQKFDEKIKQKEEEIALVLKLQKEKEEKQELEEMLEARKKTEFKAAPMPRYKFFKVHGSDFEKLTLPQSPKFSSKINA